jgi:hypothetical protein
VVGYAPVLTRLTCFSFSIILIPSQGIMERNLSFILLCSSPSSSRRPCRHHGVPRAELSVPEDPPR